MRNAGLEEAQAGKKIARRNINNLRYADATRFWSIKGPQQLAPRTGAWYMYENLDGVTPGPIEASKH